MKTATLNVRLDPSLKVQVHDILSQLGITTSEAINLFFRKIIAKNGIPFDVRIPNRATRKTIEDSRKGVGVREHKNAEGMFKALGI